MRKIKIVKNKEIRTHPIDPDFRKESGPNKCCVCQKRVTKAKKVYLGVEGWDYLVHPKDATKDNSISAIIGPECIKSQKVPKSFIVE